MPIKAYSLHISNPEVGAKWKYAVHIQDKVAALFTPYREESGTCTWFSNCWVKYHLGLLEN